jgi:hypothetical protein
VGAVLTAPWWYPSYAYPYPVYSYPTYSYPTYAYPTYSYPTYTDPAYAYPAYAPGTSTNVDVAPVPPMPPAGTEGAPPPTGGGLQAPPSGGATPGAQATNPNCQTFWVEGHYETRVMANGQRITAWVPARAEQLCQ